MRPYHAEAGIVIYHGDARELVPALQRCEVPALGHFDAVLADLPYGFGAYPGDAMIPVAPLFEVAPTVALFGYPETLVRWCLEVGRVPDEWITWWPTNARIKAGGRHKLLAREVEAIAVFGEALYPEALREPRSDNRPRVNGDTLDTVRPSDVWRDASPGVAFNARERLHPNEKPIGTLHKLVSFCSRPGELVLDPTMGSGTTLRACKDLGRRAVGIDIVEGNCETAARRLSQEMLFT